MKNTSKFVFNVNLVNQRIIIFIDILFVEFPKMESLAFGLMRVSPLCELRNLASDVCFFNFVVFNGSFYSKRMPQYSSKINRENTLQECDALYQKHVKTMVLTRQSEV